jgi:drug/metabolite transporter (DMT)-like permease
MRDGSSQNTRGVLLAGVAAILFGVTAPLLQRASVGVGTMTAAALLYLGAAAGTVMASWTRPGRGLVWPLFTGRLLARTVIVACLGAICAPALLVVGLRRMDAATGSLLLALEAPFTLTLARVAFKERLGPRVVLAASLIFGGAILLVPRPNATENNTAWGMVLVVSATFCWALDNLLSRPLADVDPTRAVFWKGAIGGGLSVAIACLISEVAPPLGRAFALLLLGAFGYGVSLRLYLRAQSMLGAARTASVFAGAPFVGAAVAFMLGSAWPGWQLPTAGCLMLVGVTLHVFERHRHTHSHEAISHDHLHTHADGHHTHTHDPMPAGSHSHQHHHEVVIHDHGHGEDIHHRHQH